MVCFAYDNLRPKPVKVNLWASLSLDVFFLILCSSLLIVAFPFFIQVSSVTLVLNIYTDNMVYTVPNFSLDDFIRTFMDSSKSVQSSKDQVIDMQDGTFMLTTLKDGRDLACIVSMQALRRVTGRKVLASVLEYVGKPVFNNFTSMPTQPTYVDLIPADGIKTVSTQPAEGIVTNSTLKK